jgi:phage terminase small subunit
MVDRIMSDPELSLTEKTKAISALKNSESKAAKALEDVAGDEIEARRTAYQKKLKEVEEYNSAVEGTKYPKQELPKLSDFGLSPTATEETIIQNSTPTEEEVAGATSQLRQQVAQQKSQQRVLQEQQQEEARRQKAAQQKVQETDDEIKAIDPNRFWSNQNTWQQIALGIALGAGGYVAGSTGKENQALNYIMKQIDNDIESQKLNNEQKLSKQKLALQKVMDEASIREKNASTDSQRMRIKQMIQEMGMKQQELAQRQQMAAWIASGGALTRDMVPEDRQSHIIRINDQIYLADSTNATNLVQQKQEKILPAIEMAKDLALKGKGNLFTSVTDRQVFQAGLQQLLGALRIEITGPGVFTDSDIALVKSVVGDPSKIFSFRDVEQAKLAGLVQRLEKSMDTTYRNAGIKQRQPKLSIKERAVQSLIETGIDPARAAELAEKELANYGY